MSLILLVQLFEGNQKNKNVNLANPKNISVGQSLSTQFEAKDIDWLVGLHQLSIEAKNKDANQALETYDLERRILDEILESVKHFLQPILSLMNVGWMLFGQIKLEDYPIEQHHLLKNTYQNFNLGSPAFKNIYATAIKNFSYELFMSKMDDNFKLTEHAGLSWAMSMGLKGALAGLEERTLTYLRGCL